MLRADFILMYRAPSPSEMKQSAIELAVLVRAKAEKKAVLDIVRIL